MSDGPLVIASSDRSGWSALLHVSGALVSAVVSAIIFTWFLMVSEDEGPVITIPVTVGTTLTLISVLRASALMRKPGRIGLSSQGVQVDGLFSSDFIPWSTIETLGFEKNQDLIDRREIESRLVARNASAEELLSVKSGFDVEEIGREAQARWRAATGRTPEEVTIRCRPPLRRRLLVAALPAVIVTLGAAVLGAVAWQVGRLAQLDDHGVMVDATIEELYLRTTNPWIHYRYADGDGGSRGRRCGMDRAAWNAAEEGGSLAIRYLPEAPGFSRMVSGERDSEIPPAVAWAAGPVMMLVGLLCIAYFMLRHDVIEVMPHVADVEEPAVAPSDDIDAPSEPELLPWVPSGIRVLGALAVAFGTCGFVFAVLRAFYFILFGESEHRVTFGSSATEPVPAAFTYGLLMVDGVLALVLVVGGVGLSVLRRWGRSACRAATVGQALATITMVAVAARVTAPALTAAAGTDDQSTILIALIALALFAAASVTFPMVLFALLRPRAVLNSLR